MTTLPVTAKDLQRLRALGDEELQRQWELAGYVAVFSCNRRECWPAPVDGLTTAENFPGGLAGVSRLLDRLVARFLKTHPNGGRFFVSENGVRTYGIGEWLRFKVVSALPRGPVPQMPIVDVPAFARCPRNGCVDFDGTRCGTCRYERGAALR